MKKEMLIKGGATEKRLHYKSVLLLAATYCVARKYSNVELNVRMF